jgi:hypothetical protein
VVAISTVEHAPPYVLCIWDRLAAFSEADELLNFLGSISRIESWQKYGRGICRDAQKHAEFGVLTVAVTTSCGLIVYVLGNRLILNACEASFSSLEVQKG